MAMLLAIVITWVIRSRKVVYLIRWAIDLPNLQNVFAAGNYGGLTCLKLSFTFCTVVKRISICKKRFDRSALQIEWELLLRFQVADLLKIGRQNRGHG
jgi:hypothetical protein